MKFYLLELLSVYNPMILEPPLRGMAVPRLAKEFGIFPVEDTLCILKNGSVEIYFNNQRKEAAEKTLESLIKKPSIAHKVHKELISNSLKLKKECDRVNKLNLSKISSRQILEEYNILEDLHFKVHTARGLGWLLETKFELLSKYINSEIKKIIEKKKLDLELNIVFSRLISSTKETLALEEKIELLKIASQIGNLQNLDKAIDKKEIIKKLKSHFNKYFYISYSIEGPGLSLKDIIDNLRNILSLSKSPGQQLKDLKNNIKNAEKEKLAIFKKLRLPIKLKEMIKIAIDISYTKLFSKYYQFYFHFCLDRILKEVGNRNLFSLRQMRFLTPREFKDFVLGKKINRDELNKRYVFSVFYQKGEELIFLSGTKAQKFLKKIKIEKEKTKDLNVKEIKGQVAFSGKVQGRVKIINNSGEMAKMSQGDILVSEMTTPELITVMKKASAIVTDSGGITCHAAIVSRELKIPCVVGTKFATQVLRDGDIVEVDADKGVVKKI